MPERKNRKSLLRQLSPGEIYRNIVVPRKKFESGDKQLFKRKEPDFVIFCKNIYHKFPSLGQKAKFKKSHAEAIDFLGWDLKPEEFAAATKFVLITSILIGAVLGTIILVVPDLYDIVAALAQISALVPVYIFGPVVIVAVFLAMYVDSYPLSAAKTEQTKALTYVPEIIGYMIMSMKLVPNLEKAVEFAAEHGRGKISDDFKKMMWDMQLGVYVSLSEALDRLAYRWGHFSDEFKRALMRLRASVLEPTDSARYELLDRTMDNILLSIKDKMEQYARDLQQPAIILFYLGILLPLILIIILPIGSAFTGAALATPMVLILIYNIAIPLATLAFAMHLVKQRPPTYDPPIIPDNYPTLPKKYQMLLGRSSFDIRMVIALVLIVGVASSFVLSTEGLPPKSVVTYLDKTITNPDDVKSQLVPFDKTKAYLLGLESKPETYYDDGGERFVELRARGQSIEQAEKIVSAERTDFFMQPENDITPYILIFGLLLTFSMCIYVYLHYTSIYKRKVQLEIMEMESEFKESLYVIASRMGENKPVEDALRHARDFLPDLMISKRIFARTVENIEMMGMPLEAAVFDESYGSLRNIPSNTIFTSMKIMIDSVNLGVNVASRSLISLSLQLNNSERVAKMLKTLVSDITQMMKTMAIYIAPVVLGITTSLQKVVMLTLASITSAGVLNQLGELSDIPGSSNLGGFNPESIGFGVTTEVFQTMVQPWQFILIVAVYVAQLVVILTFFTTRIEEDNTLLARLNIAKALPIAMVIFIIATLVSNLLVSGFM
ncbi:MAG: type II secretion system F family protein [Candidatus Diapherotrites archaeon]